MTSDLLKLFINPLQSVFEIFVDLSDKWHVSKILPEHVAATSSVRDSRILASQR